MLLVLQQLAVSTGKCVTGFTEKLQWLLLVNGTENWALPCCTNGFYRKQRRNDTWLQKRNTEVGKLILINIKEGDFYKSS